MYSYLKYALRNNTLKPMSSNQSGLEAHAFMRDLSFEVGLMKARLHPTAVKTK